jgi:hypothetical protein
MARRGAQSCGTTERSDANITALNSGRLITPCRTKTRSLRRHVVFHMETLHHSAPDNSTTTQRISPISLISPHLVLGKNQRQHVALFLNRTACKLCSQFPVLIGSHFWNFKKKSETRSKQVGRYQYSTAASDSASFAGQDFCGNLGS